MLGEPPVNVSEHDTDRLYLQSRDREFCLRIFPLYNNLQPSDLDVAARIIPSNTFLPVTVRIGCEYNVVYLGLLILNQPSCC
jgi:hypothetical protein